MNFLGVIAGLMFATAGAHAYEPSINPAKSAHEIPKELEDVGITENLGAKLDPSLAFTDDKGQAVTLGQYFTSGRPAIMAMIYYSCPNLCNYQLNGVVEVLKKMRGDAGKDYDVIAVSMDHTETSELAAAKKENYLKAMGRIGSESGWHFLVGSDENVKKLSNQLGFRFKWNEGSQQFAHAAATYILTPEGMISRYLYGIEFSPQTLRMSLIEASDGRIGSVVEQLALFCFQFDPTKNKYTLYAFNIMRIGAGLTVLFLLIFLMPAWMRERKRRTPQRV
jgi:protein SCO1/2